MATVGDKVLRNSNNQMRISQKQSVSSAFIEYILTCSMHIHKKPKSS